MPRMCSASAWFVLAGALLIVNTGGSLRADDAVFEPADVEYFEKQVRPILVARCHECHSGGEAKGGLRVDSRRGILNGGDTGPAIVVGDPDASLLIDAIRYGDLYQMPPDSQLPAEERAVLETWVRSGAAWGAESAPADVSTSNEFDLAARAGHWSFQPLAPAIPPRVNNEAWVKTPVDRFILAGLERAGLEPAASANRRTLIRRVTFDLIGLPPTPSEVEAFLADDSPGAYDRLVDRLLASPHYGERWARHWLDLVRFAETQGHEFDFEIPHAYRYRDYLIRALNADLPYNQLLIEHVAGDLLPEPRWHPDDATNESIVATGWYFFGEAVHAPVDVRADEATRIDNQIDVFSKTFLGLTVSCARCHDHKFDAISTRDYYALAGYLQSSRYQQAYIDRPEALQPTIEKLAELNRQQADVARTFAREVLTPHVGNLADALLHAERDRLAALVGNRIDHVLYPWVKLSAAGGESADAFSRARLELLAELKQQQAAAMDPARVQPVDFAGRGFAAWKATGAAFRDAPADTGAWVFAEQPGRFRGTLLSAVTAHSGRISRKLQGALRSPTFRLSSPTLWYRVGGDGGRVRLIVDGFQLIRAPIYGGLEFKPESGRPRWHRQDVSKWVGHRAYVELIDDGDGSIALQQIAFADEQPVNRPPNALLLEMLENDSIDTVEKLAHHYQSLADRALRRWIAEDLSHASQASDLASIAGWLLEQEVLDLGLPAGEVYELDRQLARIREKRQNLEAAIPAPRTAPAMADGTAENERVFIRGNHKTLGEEVPRRFLEVLGGDHHASPDEGSGRLQLALQMVSPDAALVPRVIANRLWHHHFGAGIVRTPDDFGVMGQPPTHPELLDFLAAELVSHGWSLKHLHRLMVLSNTYQMSSRVTPETERADPENKLWHRMTVRRLEAESIRDAVLRVSGSLNPTMYGPGVKPHLTDFMAGRGRPSESGPLDGEARRSIYLTVRRNFLSPLFLAFDYPTPFTTIGRRGTSNVPAQALAMLNNPFVLSQAEAWAERMLALPKATSTDRIRLMYASAFSRPPDDQELQAALQFVESGDRQDWADLAHVLLNAKEFIYIP